MALRKAIKVVGLSLGFILVAVAVMGIWVKSNTTSRLERIYEVPVAALGELNPADKELGERIVKVRSGCVDCHGEDLSGRVFIDNPPLGFAYGPNLTPAALHDWSDAEIARAIRHGIHRSGRPLLIMPSKEYMSLSKEDIKAVITYLRQLPAVEKPSQPSQLGPVGLSLLAFGKANFLAAEVIDHKMSFSSKPAEVVSPEFGRYLAQSCTGCHGESFSGGPIMGGDPSWPEAANLTVLSQWTEEDFKKVMLSGVSRAGIPLRPPMPVQLTSQLSDLELSSLWLYFKDLAPLPTGVSASH